MTSLWNDLRYAVRMLARSPGFALTAILTLALGIGANTSIFTVANALLFRSLPYRDPDALVVVTNARGVNRHPFSYFRAAFLSRHSRSLSGLAPFWNENFNLTGRGHPEELPAMRVGWNFFEILGVHPILGRAFDQEDDQPGGRAVVLISESLWKRRFAGDPNIIGQSVILDSVDTSVIGVLPAGFEFAPAGRSIDVWSSRPFEQNGLAAEDALRGQASVLGLARLRNDPARVTDDLAHINHAVPLDQAQAEMRVLDAQYLREHPSMFDADPRLNITLSPVQQLMVANVRTAVLVVFVAVGCVLLIGCANVASLLLSRAMARRKEMAIRAALGAGRRAIVRQLLVENTLLALLGGGLGTILSLWGVKALSALPPNTLPRINPIRIDSQVLAFTLALSLATGLLFGLMPALQAARADVQSVLREEGRAAAGSRRRSLARGLLVVGQVALSMILLVAANLLTRSFANLQNVPLGFNPRDLLVMDITLPSARYPSSAQLANFFDRALAEISPLHGVRSAAWSSALPLRPSNYGPIRPEGQKDLPTSQRPNHSIVTISPTYFETMGIALMRGRAFDRRDTHDASPVAIVNDCFARRYWPNDTALGKRIFIGNSNTPAEVVGVVANVKNIRLSVESVPEVYRPLAQHPSDSMHLVIRDTSNSASLVAAVRARVSAVDPDQPVTRVRTMQEHLASSISQNRFTALLVGAFSILALIVATVGLYGLIAYSVEQRTDELGVRLALGAKPASVVRLVMRQGLLAAIVGILIGMAGSFGLTRMMNSLLYQVSATDTLVFTVSAIVFLAVALVASYIPARRAACLDPIATLRHE